MAKYTGIICWGAVSYSVDDAILIGDIGDRVIKIEASGAGVTYLIKLIENKFSLGD